MRQNFPRLMARSRNNRSFFASTTKKQHVLPFAKKKIDSSSRSGPASPANFGFTEQVQFRPTDGKVRQPGSFPTRQSTGAHGAKPGPRRCIARTVEPEAHRDSRAASGPLSALAEAAPWHLPTRRRAYISTQKKSFMDGMLAVKILSERECGLKISTILKPDQSIFVRLRPSFRAESKSPRRVFAVVSNDKTHVFVCFRNAISSISATGKPHFYDPPSPKCRNQRPRRRLVTTRCMALFAWAIPPKARQKNSGLPKSSFNR